MRVGALMTLFAGSGLLAVGCVDGNVPAIYFGAVYCAVGVYIGVTA